MLFNEYFPFSLDSEHTLLTTRHGGWAILSAQEYSIFKSGELNQNSVLFQALEEAGIVLTKKSTERVIDNLRTENDFLLRPQIIM